MKSAKMIIAGFLAMLFVSIVNADIPNKLNSGGDGLKGISSSSDCNGFLVRDANGFCHCEEGGGSGSIATTGLILKGDNAGAAIAAGATDVNSLLTGNWYNATYINSLMAAYQTKAANDANYSKKWDSNTPATEVNAVISNNFYNKTADDAIMAEAKRAADVNYSRFYDPNTLPASLADPNAHAGCMVVYPDQNLIDAYAWLKSSDRNASMGTLPATRRTLFIAGTFDVNGANSATGPKLVLDTAGVDIVGLNGDPCSNIITASMGSTVQITNPDVHINGITIRNTGSPSKTWTWPSVPVNIGLDINCGYGDGLKIVNANLEGTAIATLYNGSVPVFFNTNSNGAWRNVNTTGQAFRAAENVTIGGTFKDGVNWHQYVNQVSPDGYYGWYCMGGDLNGVVVDANIINWKAGSYFAGCVAYSCKVAGYIENLSCGVQSLAVQRSFTGTIRNSLCGVGSLAAGDYYQAGGNPGGTGDVNAYFNGVAENVEIRNCGSEGINKPATSAYFSFADGNTNGPSVRSQGIGPLAVIRNCKIIRSIYGSDNDGNNLWPPNIQTNNYATLTTNFTNGVNANVIITAKSADPEWNSTKYQQLASGSPSTFTLSVIGKGVFVTKGSTARTGTALKALLDGDANFTNYWTCTLAGTGASNIPSTSYTGQYAFGGSYYPTFTNNRTIPVNCTGGTVYITPVYNGATYDNANATARVLYTLPPAFRGSALVYDLQDSNDTDGADVNIVIAATDRFKLPNGIYMSLGEQIANETDRPMNMKVAVEEPNVWTIKYFSKSADITVYGETSIPVWWSGRTIYYNGSAAANLTLPQAETTNSWYITINDVNNTAGADPNIKPYPGDYFLGMDVNQGIISASDGRASAYFTHDIWDANIIFIDFNTPIGAWTNGG
jgi:hypothetical protein